MEKHIVIGANGGVGKQLIKALRQKGKSVCAVSRSENRTDIESRQADATRLDELKQATHDASHMYLTLGIPFSTVEWQKSWPTIMENTIAAFESASAKLLFLDNIYMYGPPPLSRPFNEDHPQDPSSEKGKVRKQIAHTLLQASKEGRVQALIARAADFWGPDANNSILYIQFLENMLKGKAPMSLFPIHVEHTFANTIDIAQGLCLLAGADDTWGRVWHLPVEKPTTISSFGDLFNSALGSSRRVKDAPSWLKSMLGMFIPAIREPKEMNYQFTSPYVMDWTAFAERFPDFRTTSREEVAKAMIASFR